MKRFFSVFMLPFLEVGFRSKLRIMEITDVSCIIRYRIEKRFLFVFWLYAVTNIGYDVYSEIIFDTVLEAKKFIEQHKAKINRVKRSKIIKQKTVEL